MLPTVTNAKELEAAVADGALWRRAARVLSDRSAMGCRCPRNRGKPSQRWVAC